MRVRSRLLWHGGVKFSWFRAHVSGRQLLRAENVPCAFVRVLSVVVDRFCLGLAERCRPGGFPAVSRVSFCVSGDSSCFTRAARLAHLCNLLAGEDPVVR